MLLPLLFVGNEQSDTNSVNRGKRSHNVHWPHQIVGKKKRKRIGNPHKCSENIQSENRDGIWHRKTCHAKSEKQETTHDGQNQITKSRKIRTLGEKQTYKYVGILEADTIKQVEMKEEIKKEYFGRVVFRRTRKLREIKLYSRNLIKEMDTCTAPPRKILGTILGVDQRRT